MPGMICSYCKDKVFYKDTYAWVLFSFDSPPSQIPVVTYVYCVATMTRTMRTAKLREIKPISQNQKNIYFTVQK